MLHDKAGIKGIVVAVLKNVDTGATKVFTSENLVTSSGDIYYAQVAASGRDTLVTNKFWSGVMVLGLSTVAAGLPAKSSIVSSVGTSAPGSMKRMDDANGYPRTNDPDTDNTVTGAAVVTYRASWGTTDTTGTFDSVVIATSGVSDPVGPTDPVLMHAQFTSFTKTSSDTLKVFVNHTFSGV